MTRTQRILLVALAVLFVLVLFNYLVYQPKQAEYRTLLAERDKQTAERDRLRGVAARREALEQEFESLQTSIPALEAKLPTAKEVPALLVQLEQLATSLRVDLLNITIGGVQRAQPPRGGAQQPPAAQAAGVGTVPLVLNVTATYQQLVALLAQLHDFPRLIAVHTLSLNPGGLPRLNVGISAETYVLAREAR